MKSAIASMAFCLIMAAMISQASAEVSSVDLVEVQPVSPEVWDSLTCHAEVSDSAGDLDHVRFTWYRNGVGIRVFEQSVSGYTASVSDMLDSSYTKELDQIRCKVEVFDSWSCSDYEEVTVTVQATSQNSPPIISGIPDQEIEIGETLQIDLWDFAYDVDEEDSALSFSLTSQGNTDITECWISGDRFLYCGQGKQLGETSLTVRVTDSQGAWDYDSFDVRVAGDVIFPDNKAPDLEFMDIDPNTPDPEDDLTCEARASDEDGNLDNVEFRWYVEGSLERTRVVSVSGFEDTATDRLDSSEFGENDDVECRVTVEDEDGEEDTGTRSVRIEDLHDGTCRIDVRDIEVEDEEDIEVVIRNNGDLDADVEYRIYVDGDRIERDDIYIDEHDSERITFRWFDFEEGETYEIRVRAEADCGSDEDTDERTVHYTIIDSGDHCSATWLDSYRCSGSWTQRLYRDSDCYTTWKNWKHCTYGCSSGVCLGSSPGPSPGPVPVPGCSLVIDSFEHSKTVSPGSTGFVRATVRNSGHSTQEFHMDVYLDGHYQGSRTFVLPSGTSTEKVWNYNVATPGAHTVSITVSSDCGSVQTRQGTINAGHGTPSPQACNYNGVCEAGEDFYNCPYDCEEPETDRVPTEVEISPNTLDVPLYKSKVVTIEIASSVRQDFTVRVDGVPRDWLTYEPRETVEDRMFSYVFVNPREQGTHDMKVTVTAETEGLTFSEEVRMFVTESEEVPGEDPVTGFVSALVTNVWAIIIIIIVAAVLLVWYSHRYLRSEDEVTFENMEKRDVLTN